MEESKFEDVDSTRDHDFVSGFSGILAVSVALTTMRIGTKGFCGTPILVFEIIVCPVRRMTSRYSAAAAGAATARWTGP